MLGLAQVIPTDCQGIPKSLADHALKVRVHVGMRAQPAAKEKPRRSGAIVKSETGGLTFCGHPKVSVSKISHTSGFCGQSAGFTWN